MDYDPSCTTTSGSYAYFRTQSSQSGRVRCCYISSGSTSYNYNFNYPGYVGLPYTSYAASASYNVSTPSYRPEVKFCYRYLSPCPDPDSIVADLATMTSTSATISWVPGGGDYENGWDVYVSPTQITDFSTVTPTAHVTTTSYTFTTLTAGTSYYAYVRAVCNGEGHNDGNSNWAEGTFTTPNSCPTPLNLRVPTAGITGNAAQVMWSDAGGVTSWDVKYVIDGGGTTDTVTLFAVTDTIQTIWPLIGDTTYHVWVRSNCSSGVTSVWTPSVDFRTILPPANSCVQVGNGTTSSTAGPIVYSSWGNTSCQMVFTAAELTSMGLTAGDILSVTLNFTQSSSYDKEFSIYMGTTTMSTIAASSMVSLTTLTHVYGPTPFYMGPAGE